MTGSKRIITLFRALRRPMLMRGIGLWFGVRSLLVLIAIAFSIESAGFPSLGVPVMVAGLAFAHSMAMKELIYYRNLGIRWLPVIAPAVAAMGLELVIAGVIRGG